MEASAKPREQVIVRLEPDELDKWDQALQMAMTACTIVALNSDDNLATEMNEAAGLLEQLKDAILQARFPELS